MVLFEDVEDPHRADQLARRIRAAIDTVSVQASDGSDVGLRSSVGMAWTDPAMPIDDLVALADKRTYETKRTRRSSAPVTVEADPRRSTTAPAPTP